jgi:hypothetical protein
VTLENTFGKLKIRTASGAGLLVPTQQIAQASPFSDRLDHYKVYRLADLLQVPSSTLTLQDQFGSSKAQASAPEVRKHRSDRGPASALSHARRLHGVAEPLAR